MLEDYNLKGALLHAIAVFHIMIILYYDGLEPRIIDGGIND